MEQFRSTDTFQSEDGNIFVSGFYVEFDDQMPPWIYEYSYFDREMTEIPLHLRPRQIAALQTLLAERKNPRFSRG